MKEETRIDFYIGIYQICWVLVLSIIQQLNLLLVVILVVISLGISALGAYLRRENIEFIGLMIRNNLRFFVLAELVVRTVVIGMYFATPELPTGYLLALFWSGGSSVGMVVWKKFVSNESA